MSSFRLLRPRAALAAALATLCVTAAQATTISYANLGSFNVATLNVGGVSVTGSSTLRVINLNGLGVVGGANDNVVDGSEYLDFSFTGLGSAVNLSYRAQGAGDLDADNFIGMRSLSVFGVGGGLLGSFSQNGVGPFDVSSLVGNAPIERIRLQANVDFFRPDSITFTAQAVNPVPVPATPALMLAALGAGALLRRRRARATA